MLLGWEKVLNSRAFCAAVTGGCFSQHTEQPRSPAEVSIDGASATTQQRREPGNGM